MQQARAKKAEMEKNKTNLPKKEKDQVEEPAFDEEEISEPSTMISRIIYEGPSADLGQPPLLRTEKEFQESHGMNFKISSNFDLTPYWKPGVWGWKDYRNCVKHLDMSMITTWCDKLLLHRWLTSHNIPAPPIIWSSTDPNFDVRPIISKMSSYVVKPNHLSERVGVIVVKDGILLNSVKIAYAPKQKFYKWQGFKITPEEVQEVAEMMFWTNATWEADVHQTATRAILVEELNDGHAELKMVVGLGKVWTEYWYRNWTSDTFDKRICYNLAEKTARMAGVDLVRVDVMQFKNKLYVNEFTWNPNEPTTRFKPEDWAKLDRFYSSRNALGLPCDK